MAVICYCEEDGLFYTCVLVKIYCIEFGAICWLMEPLWLCETDTLVMLAFIDIWKGYYCCWDEEPCLCMDYCVLLILC